MTKRTFALGAFVGTMAGVVAGLLTAPRSGKETRADIRQKANELKAKAAKRSLMKKTPNKSKEQVWEKSAKKSKKPQKK